MENQNILTIKFNTLDDLAVQVADWNERLNHQCCGNCSNVEAPTVTVGETIDIEVAASEVAGKVDIKQQPEPVEVEPAQKDVPVTDFEGKSVTNKKEEKVEPVDKKAFYKEFREWMGEDGVKAKKALAIFSKHGVTRPSSDSLTDDLITDLKSIMAEEA